MGQAQQERFPVKSIFFFQSCCEMLFWVPAPFTELPQLQLESQIVRCFWDLAVQSNTGLGAFLSFKLHLKFVTSSKPS